MKNFMKAVAMTIVVIGTASVSNAAICAEVGPITLTTAPVAVPEIGGGCQVGGYDFSNFTITGVVGVPAANFSFAVNTLANGLSFGYSNVVGLDFTLTYTVDPGIPGMMLSTNSAVAITETLCTVVYDPTIQNCVGAGGTAASGTTSSTTAPALISLPGAQLATFAFKDVNGGSDFTQTIVPEPLSISLVGFGLLGVGLIGRRARK